MEVAGVALGIVPLVCAAIKQYGTLHKVCRRYKGSQDGLSELLDSLKVQQAIFKAESRLLLTTIVGEAIAREMVDDPQHLEWSNATLESSIVAILAGSQEAMQIATKQVYERIDKMEKEIIKLSRGDGLRNTFRSKFRFATSESKLASMTIAIRDATADYRALRAQIKESRTSHSRTDPQVRQDVEAEHIEATRIAAKHVYKELARACRSHPVHRCYIGLQPSYRSSNTGSEVNFAFAYCALSQNTQWSNEDISWFSVQYIISEKIPPEPRLLPSLSSSSATPSPAIRDTFPHFGITGDLCAELVAHRGSNEQSSKCIGLLTNSKSQNHRVFLSKSPIALPVLADDAENTPNLAVIFNAWNRLSSNAMSISRSVLERIRLAKIISSAVLSFHATPWMQPTWTSQNILIYSAAPNVNKTPEPSEAVVYVEVPIQRPNKGMPRQKLTKNTSPYVRNEVLFSLGVILLELAFAKTLEEMRRYDGKKQLQLTTETSYDFVLSQMKEVSSQMGLKYSELVERCVHCDFGHGSDLSSPALQSAVQQFVVNEFGKLETGLLNSLQTLGILT